MTKNLLVVLLILIAGLLIFQNKSTGLTTIVTKIDTVYTDTSIIRYVKGDKIPFKVIDSIPYQVSIHDTQFIVNDYNTIRNYRDTILFDSNSFVINDTITQNKIIGRSLEMNLHERKIIVTNTITKPDKNAIYFGGGSNFKTAFIGIQYKMPNQIIGLSFVSDKSFQLSYYVRFH